MKEKIIKRIEIVEGNNIKCNNNYEYNTTQGFDNIGNSCYMNSFLQILLHCPNFLYRYTKTTGKRYSPNFVN